MRTCTWVLTLVVACGGDPARHTPDATPTGDAPADIALDACSASYCCSAADCPGSSSVCADHACVDVGGTLTGLLWELPCGGDLSSTVCATTPTANVTATVGGTTGYTYDVTVHLRGVVEQKTYAGGCRDSTWLSGGADNGDAYNVYELSVSSPPQHYFLNAGTSNIQNSYVIDTEKVVRADAGATVTLFASSKDSQEIKNIDAAGQPLSVVGTSVVQPYNGQFIELDVVSVTPDPVASGATLGSGGPSSALSFSAGQLAQVGDAVSLDSSDLTVETWFQMAGAPGAFDSLIGRPVAGATADSFAIWYESGGLHAGTMLGNTANSATVPWTPTAGEWHHAALAYDHVSGIATLYVDGQAAACAANSAPVYDNQPMMFGADSNNGQLGGFWSGLIDDVHLFDVARTSDEIWADMHTHTFGPTTSLVGQWTFDEGSGQTSADSSGAGNTLTLGQSGSADAMDPAWVRSDVPH